MVVVVDVVVSAALDDAISGVLVDVAGFLVGTTGLCVVVAVVADVVNSDSAFVVVVVVVLLLWFL